MKNFQDKDIDDDNAGRREMEEDEDYQVDFEERFDNDDILEGMFYF